MMSQAYPLLNSPMTNRRTEFIMTGDCKKVGTVQQCSRSAFDAAMNL